MQNDFYSATPRLGLSVVQIHNPTVHLKTKELSLEVYSDYSILIDKIEQTISNNVFTDRVKFNRISDKKIVLYSEHGEYKGIDLAHSFIVQYEEAIKITGKPTQLKWKAFISFLATSRGIRTIVSFLTLCFNTALLAALTPIANTAQFGFFILLMLVFANLILCIFDMIGDNVF